MLEIYCSDDVPYLFQIAKKRSAALYPTVYALMRVPNLLPAIRVHQKTPSYLIKGADLMIPGCLSPCLTETKSAAGTTVEDGSAVEVVEGTSERGLACGNVQDSEKIKVGADGLRAYLDISEIDRDQPWAVLCHGNPVPFAVGTVLLSRDEIAECDKGKALQNVHTLDDLIARFGAAAYEAKGGTFPPGFTPTSCVPITGDAVDIGDIDIDDEVAEGENTTQAPSSSTGMGVGVGVGTTGTNASPTQTNGSPPETNVSLAETSASPASTSPTASASPESSASPEASAPKPEGSAESGAPANFPKAAVDCLLECVLFDVLKNDFASPDVIPIDVSTVLGKMYAVLPVACSEPGIVAVRDWFAQRGLSEGEASVGGDDGESGKRAETASDSDSDSENEGNGDDDGDDGEEGKATQFSIENMTGVDLKKSSWKNAKKFANHFKKIKVWKLKENRGVQVVVGINFQHPVMQSHRVFRAPAATVKPVSVGGSRSSRGASGKGAVAGGAASSQSLTPTASVGTSPPSATTGYQITSTVKDWFLRVGYPDDRKKVYMPDELRIVLTKIFSRLNSRSARPAFPVLGGAGDKNVDLDWDAIDSSPTDTAGADTAGTESDLKLPWHELLPRDGVLMGLCLSKAERQAVKLGAAPPKISDSVIHERFMKNGMKAVTILAGGAGGAGGASGAGASRVLEADARITISVIKTKRFTRTKIAGIHDFPGLEARELAERLQKCCAASASVAELDEIKGKSKPMGVLIQGAVVNEVKNALLKYYQIPPELISTV